MNFKKHEKKHNFVLKDMCMTTSSEINLNKAHPIIRLFQKCMAFQHPDWIKESSKQNMNIIIIPIIAGTDEIE